MNIYLKFYKKRSTWCECPNSGEEVKVVTKYELSMCNAYPPAGGVPYTLWPYIVAADSELIVLLFCKSYFVKSCERSEHLSANIRA